MKLGKPVDISYVSLDTAKKEQEQRQDILDAIHALTSAIVKAPAPVVNVKAPDVKVAAPSVMVKAPEVTVNSPKCDDRPRKWTFEHTYDSDHNLIKTVATAQ